jgi:hypothetical protein
MQNSLRLYAGVGAKSGIENRVYGGCLVCCHVEFESRDQVGHNLFHTSREERSIVVLDRERRTCSFVP